jgi:hypothetical protein
VVLENSNGKEIIVNKLGRGAAALLGLFLAGMSSPVLADHWHGGHGHADVGIVVSPFWFDPWYYPRPYAYSPYYYPPAVVTVPSTPPVYIEREADVPPASAYWYYCANPQGYYPSVKQCPGGWQAVAPQSSGEER